MIRLPAEIFMGINDLQNNFRSPHLANSSKFRHHAREYELEGTMDRLHDQTGGHWKDSNVANGTTQLDALEFGPYQNYDTNGNLVSVRIGETVTIPCTIPCPQLLWLL